MKTLEERVARTIATTGTGFDFDELHRDKRHWIETQGKIAGHYHDINQVRQDDLLETARAIIPLVLEEAAKVADEYAAWHNKMDDGLSGLDKMAEGAREVAEVIRALGETK